MIQFLPEATADEHCIRIGLKKSQLQRYNAITELTIFAELFCINLAI